MNKKIIPLIIASSTLIVACNEEKAPTNETSTAPVTTISKEDAVAVVNGKYISKTSLATLESEIAQRSRGQSFPKEQLLEELIQRELLVQDAIQKQLDTTTEFAERLATIKQSLLSQAAIQNYLKSNPVSDAELEAEYNKNSGEAGTEYKARHILVKTEEEAKQLIEELNKGTDFAELAKSKSTGPSGPQGGDLGWFTAGQMVAPFSEAAIALEDGKYTTEPVQTQFGWHVILKEGSRAQTPPPFESVKEQIRPMLKRQKMQDFMESLRQQAKVEVLLPKPEPKVEAVAPETAAAEATESSSDKTVAEDVAETAEVVKNEVVETSEAVKADVTVETEKAAEKIAETVDSATKEAETVVKESAEKASEAVTKPVDAITQ